MKTADSPCNFLTSPIVKQSVKELLHKGKESKLIWHEIRIVLAYLAAHIIYWNGQWPEVVQRMTVDERFKRVEEDGEFLHVRTKISPQTRFMKVGFS